MSKRTASDDRKHSGGSVSMSVPADVALLGLAATRLCQESPHAVDLLSAQSLQRKRETSAEPPPQHECGWSLVVVTYRGSGRPVVFS